MKEIASQRTYLRLAVLATITILVFYAIVKQFDVSELPGLLAQVSLPWVILGTAIGFATSPFLNTIRWQAILRGAGYSIGFKKVFLITLANWSFMVLPGRLGDLLKSYPLRHEVPVNHSIVSIIIEKVIDVLSLISLIIVGSLLLREPLILTIAMIVFLGVVLVIGLTRALSTRFLVRWFPGGKTRDALEHFDHMLRSLLSSRKYLYIAVASSLGNWLTNIAAVWSFYRAFHLVVPTGAVLAYLPVSIFIGLLPVTVAGMGTRDAALIQFFAPYAGAAQSLGVGILYSISAYWLPVLIGLCFIYGPGFSASLLPRNIGSRTTN